jgi:hypothetical protein
VEHHTSNLTQFGSRAVVHEDGELVVNGAVADKSRLNKGEVVVSQAKAARLRMKLPTHESQLISVLELSRALHGMEARKFAGLLGHESDEAAVFGKRVLIDYVPELSW